MTSTQTASFAPQIVRISASTPREAHEAHEAQNNANLANNSELSDVDGDSDFDYDGSDDDRSPPARHGHIRVPPQLSWATAAEDASNGIQYIKERFPGDNIPYLPTPFRQEPIKVEPDDKVVVLDEVTEHAVRVRLVKTGEVGIIPNWTVEDPLEKLARQNMIWNEIATSPAVEEPTTINTIRLPARRRYSPEEDADMDEELDSDWPLTPTSPTTSFMPSSSNARRPLLIPSKPSTSHSASKAPSSSSTLRLKRKVEFSSSPRKMIFRYFAPHDPESQWDSDSDSGSEASAQRSEEARDNGSGAREEQEGDSNWWWDGWEEAHDDDEEDDDREHSDVREGPFDIDRERERWRQGQRRRTFIVA